MSRLMEVYYKISVTYSYIIFSMGIIGKMVGILWLVQIDMKSIDMKSMAYTSVVHMNLMLCSLMTFFKVEMLKGSGDVMMISHGLRSSGMFYVVNLYYERSSSRLLFLNKGMMSNLPTVMMLWWFLFCIMNFK